MSLPQVSVVFATHDRAGRLRALLAALREQTLDDHGTFEVIVVDDGSSDDTPQVLTTEQAAGGLDLRWVQNERPRGPAAARNIGWRAARAPVIAFTDDDCRPERGWLRAGLEAMGAPVSRIVQGATEPDPLELSALGPFTRTLRVTRLGPFYQTCNVFYPRKLLERHGGFDELTFTKPGGEDADLAWRCLEAGAETAFAPRARVFHAVERLGPLGKLRVAWRWTETMSLYARHPQLRALVLEHRVFWKLSHYLLLRAGLGLGLRRAPGPVRFVLMAPLIPYYRQRSKDERAAPWQAPYFVLHDLVEIAATVRGAVRYRTLVI